MDRLPLALPCSLDEGALSEQLERYREAGRGARVIERTSRSLVLELDRRTDPAVVERMIATERECCPFFELAWDPDDRRRLTLSVSHADHKLALDTLASALTAKRTANRTAAPPPPP